MSKYYRYKTFPRSTVRAVTQGVTPPDSYLTESDCTKAIRNAMEEGYRWVRSDGADAVFELKLTEEENDRDIRLRAHGLLEENTRERMFEEGVKRFTNFHDAAALLGCRVDDLMPGEPLAAVYVDEVSGWHYFEMVAGDFLGECDRSSFRGTEQEVRDALKENYFA